MTCKQLCISFYVKKYFLNGHLFFYLIFFVICLFLFLAQSCQTVVVLIFILFYFISYTFCHGTCAKCFQMCGSSTNKGSRETHSPAQTVQYAAETLSLGCVVLDSFGIGTRFVARACRGLIPCKAEFKSSSVLSFLL